MGRLTREKIKEITIKYQDHPDIRWLLSEIFNLELKLVDADVMAMLVDVAVKRGLLDARSGISDARNDYGTPWEYEFAPRRLLLGYKGGIPEVQEALERNH